ncbi:hypothetical protein M4I21_12455 [Cellulophaga sp. 20_2_10]|uniref:hypothetical protein n=1 Tax=Cellulophaga sp. 20_2_10 TaxID=2942476 RepID=UPI00201A945E|nr:hypothetical protein [Cellulophaga sp. 20_2_10]MCL5246628.1 hypothetical protein [Cellulophaga sp. 20_2_10]
MKKIAFIITVLIVLSLSCKQPEIKTTPKIETRQNNASIKEISVSTFGGRSTIKSATYVFTKGSIRYRLVAHDTTKNVITYFINTETDWAALCAKIDLKRFKGIKSGKSIQPTDGSDTKISITTESGKEYYKINGSKNEVWTNIRKELRVQINGLKETKKTVVKDTITAEQIKNITQLPYIENCNDVIFWSLVKQKENIPELLKKLTDTTVLKGVYVPNFGGEYTVADAALVILREKIKGIPVLELIGQERSSACGYCSYWLFVRKSDKNRLLFQQNLKNWYSDTKTKLVWATSNSSLTGDCISPVKGHYIVKE